MLTKIKEVYRIKYDDSRLELEFYPPTNTYEIWSQRLQKEHVDNMLEAAHFIARILIFTNIIRNE